MADDGKHDCPVDGCTKRVPAHILMCKSHWQTVPRQLQRDVYATYAHGTGVATEEYAEARRLAIDAVENLTPWRT